MNVMPQYPRHQQPITPPLTRPLTRPINKHSSALAPGDLPSRVRLAFFPARATLLLLTAAAVLMAFSACAQSPDATKIPSAETVRPAQAPAVPAASTPAPAPLTPAAGSPSAAQTPEYTASNIALAFGFIDSNKDGKLSREEAAGFPGVAKYFDAADANKDNFLSPEEFEHAMNRSKPR